MSATKARTVALIALGGGRAGTARHGARSGTRLGALTRRAFHLRRRPSRFGTRSGNNDSIRPHFASVDGTADDQTILEGVATR